jgi:hypothetical protein
VDAEQKQVDNGMIFGSFDPKLSESTKLSPFLQHHLHSILL